MIKIDFDHPQISALPAKMSEIVRSDAVIRVPIQPLHYFNDYLMTLTQACWHCHAGDNIPSIRGIRATWIVNEVILKNLF